MTMTNFHSQFELTIDHHTSQANYVMSIGNVLGEMDRVIRNRIIRGRIM